MRRLHSLLTCTGVGAAAVYQNGLGAALFQAFLVNEYRSSLDLICGEHTGSDSRTTAINKTKIKSVAVTDTCSNR